MAGKSEPQAPLKDPEAATPVIDTIRLTLKTQEVATIQDGKMLKVAGIAAELYLPAPGQRGVRSPDTTFFGNNVGEIFTYLATWAGDRTLAEFGVQIQADNAVTEAQANGKANS